MIWTTTTKLYPHQAAAVDKVRPSRVGGLFMEMGTGKTRAAIELAYQRRTRYDRMIWFCPVSLKQTIAYEWRKHTDLPDSAICVFDDRTSERTLPRDALVFIVGIESMSSSDRVVFAARSLITTRSFVVVDESSFMKGYKSLRSERLRILTQHCRYRLILTGTPLTQGVQDLFAQMRFLSPKILGYHSYYSFAANHLEYSDKYPGMIVRAHNTGLLAAKMAPYVYQVTKAECLDLPAKLYERRYCDLTGPQRNAYAQAKEELLFAVDEEDLSVYHIFRLFTALQQIVCGFWQRQGETLIFPHRRLGLLDGALADIAADEKVIIWAKYRRCIADITNHLRQQHGKSSVAQFFGDLSEHDRAVELERFRQQARFLVATPATGGYGLTLNNAACVVYYTNGFKYAERIQSEDRCHRIGQTQPVTYIDLVATGTIDQRIQDALVRKESLIDAFKRRITQVKDKDKREVRKAIHELTQEL
jgi:SNF2 family DNA or RNA helicase